MSTVRMSDYLILEIINAFENSYDKAHSPLEVETKYGDKIYNTYIGPNIESLLAAAESSFGNLFNAQTMFGKSFNIQACGPVTTSAVVNDTFNKNSVETTLQEDFIFSISLSTERLVPKRVENYHVEDVRFHFDRYEDKNVNYVCEAIEYNSKLKAKKSLSSREVKALLQKFTTLNQALKAWPALSKLVTSEKLAKVHEKQQRKRNQELQKEMADEVVVDHELNKTILTGALIEDDK